jgi:hypothetical protein
MVNDNSDTEQDTIPPTNPILRAFAATLIQRRFRGNNIRAQFLLYRQALADHCRLSAVQIQRIFRGLQSRQQATRGLQSRQQATLLSFIPSMTTPTSTDYEFPGFKVAVDLASPALNIDGLSAGRLYKKENRPKEGTKEEKELLTDIKAAHYPKYKVMNVSLKDPEKLASNLSILDNLTYSEQLMIELNMEDPFRICLPDSTISLASLAVDLVTSKPIFKDLFVDHREITVEQVALSNRWYSRYAIFTVNTGTDRSFAKELEWSFIHLRNHVEQDLFNVIHSEYLTFPADERGGPLFLKLLMLHLVVSNEANLEILVDTVKNYKINENVDNEDVTKVIRLLKAVTATIIHLRMDKKLPEKYIEHLCTALQTTSCPEFNQEIAGIEKDVTTSRRIQSANQSAAMRQHTGAITVAATVSGLILANDMQGVDFLFSMAQATYRDLTNNGVWNASMRPTPGTAPSGGFIAADQITGPFCWNCESTDHAFPQCTKPRNEESIAKNRTLYRQHKGQDPNKNSGRRGDGANRWAKWKKPRPEENNKRIINGDPYTWVPNTKRWSKDDTTPSGLASGVPTQSPTLPSQQAGDDQTRPLPSRTPPFPPTSIGDDGGSQASETLSQADLASFQLQLANMMNVMNKYG